VYDNGESAEGHDYVEQGDAEVQPQRRLPSQPRRPGRGTTYAQELCLILNAPESTSDPNTSTSLSSPLCQPRTTSESTTVSNVPTQLRLEPTESNKFAEHTLPILQQSLSATRPWTRHLQHLSTREAEVEDVQGQLDTEQGP
jgi:hypothetical protein